MRIQKFGHCCLVVECEGVRLLIDPGVFSTGFEELRDLTAVLITHVHQDHLDVDRVRVLMAHNVQASVLCDELSAVVLAEQAVTGLVVRGDERIDLGVQIRVYANRHAVIHPDVPNIPNMGYSIAGRFFYGGDAFTMPAESVEILALPVSGVWMKLSESIDYLREVRPRIALPVHDHQDVWFEMACGLLRELGPEGTTVTALKPSEMLEI